MAILYVTSRQSGSGKTAMCAVLADGLARRGRRAAAIKPLSGQGDSSGDADNAAYASLLSQAAPATSFALPGGEPDADVIERAAAACRIAAEGRDLLLVEATAELSDGGAQRLIESLDARVLAVERYDPGLTGADLDGLRRQYGGRLAGVVVNGLTRYQATRANAELAGGSGSPVLLGVVPEDRRLLGVTVERLVEHLDGRYVVDEGKKDALVEHLLVGGMGLDSGELYFGTRDSKAVIVRGDRPDVQMSALTTPTLCLLLTGGIDPIEYVLYEAELEEVPVAVVPAETLDAMAALNDLSARARFDHPAKLPASLGSGDRPRRRRRAVRRRGRRRLTLLLPLAAGSLSQKSPLSSRERVVERYRRIAVVCRRFPVAKGITLTSIPVSSTGQALSRKGRGRRRAPVLRQTRRGRGLG